MEQLSGCNQAALVTISRFQKATSSCTDEMWHSTHPSDIRVHHCKWRVLPGLPLQKTNPGAKRPGYKAINLGGIVHRRDKTLHFCVEVNKCLKIFSANTSDGMSIDFN